jgi:hypothetical protein
MNKVAMQRCLPITRLGFSAVIIFISLNYGIFGRSGYRPRMPDRVIVPGCQIGLAIVSGCWIGLLSPDARSGNCPRMPDRVIVPGWQIGLLSPDGRSGYCPRWQIGLLSPDDRSGYRPRMPGSYRPWHAHTYISTLEYRDEGPDGDWLTREAILF